MTTVRHLKRALRLSARFPLFACMLLCSAYISASNNASVLVPEASNVNITSGFQPAPKPNPELELELELELEPELERELELELGNDDALSVLAEQDKNKDVTVTPAAPKIAIVIDDLGYKLEPAITLAELPYPITMAVIPFSPFAEDVVALTAKYKQELILHVPMQTMQPRKWEDGLTVDMRFPEMSQAFLHMLDSYPDIVGINNHGGSRFTSDRQHMLWLMRLLAPRELYFLDSRTTSASQAIEAAVGFGIDHTSRDVFLDNVQDETAIAAEFDRLRVIARKHGQALAIGHPHPSTLAQLHKQLPKLVEEGFELSFCSALLSRRQKHVSFSRKHVKTPP